VGTTGTKEVQLYKHIRFILHTETQSVLGEDQGEETKLRGFSPQANYTDRAIDAGQRS
jgi:predicted N-acyltransferase